MSDPARPDEMTRVLAHSLLLQAMLTVMANEWPGTALRIDAALERLGDDRDSMRPETRAAIEHTRHMLAKVPELRADPQLEKRS